ncbi:MAG: hypothetical protein ACOX9R_19645, partial [Armatimonadota bacterium]
VLALIGLVALGVIVSVIIAVIVWLIVRSRSSAQAGGPVRPDADRQAGRAQAEAPAGREADQPEGQPQPEAAPGEFEVVESAGGPHPRPRELDRESRRELLLLDERLHRAFFDQSRMSPGEWARVADALLIVHDRLPPGILLERFERATGTRVSAPQRTEMSPREIFAALNAQLSPERRMALVGRLAEPLNADAYAHGGADGPDA